MDEFIYYFYNFNVETATTEIFLPGWQKLTPDEITQYLDNDYIKIVKNGDRYSFSNESTTIPFDLDSYKNEKIRDLSYLRLSVGEVVAPTYKFNNCLLSKEMEENGEIPIYSNWREVMDEYKIKRIALRNEYYRLKSVVENAFTKEDIDQLFTPNIYIL